MALPCPGPDPISLLDIQNEFGGTADTQIIEYYRGGAYVPNTAGNSAIPTSGQISFDDFFCSSAIPEIVVYITQDTANVVVSTLFGTDWTSSIAKRLVVNSGVVVYNTNPYEISNLDGYAMRIYDTFNGSLTIENNGSIEGASGRAGGTSIITGESRTNQDHGGQGGNAIYIGPTTYNGSALSKTVNIDNQGGTIYAGGGGGGTGGSNSTATSSSSTYNYRPYGSSSPLDAVVKGRSVEGGDGGRGQGYNKIWMTGISASYVGAEVTVSMTSLGGNSFRFPKDSIITINAQSSGQVTHYFSSNSNITYNMNSSGTTGGLSFAGSNNNITLNRYSSGFSGTITKDPNQSYADNPDSSSGFTGSVSNVSGGGPEQTSGQIKLVANGVNATITFPGVGTQYRGGTGGTWGNSGQTGNNSGSPGGASGYAILNASQYVNYIDQGTIAGQTT